MRIEGSYREPDDDPIEHAERKIALALKELKLMKEREKFRQEKEAFDTSMKQKKMELIAGYARIGLSIAAAAVFIILCFSNEDEIPVYKLAGLLAIAGFTINWSGLIPKLKRRNRLQIDQ
ncbi:MAG TPA: hypothetical protein VEB42_03170 [Chitinophagaceae bacterium]|nr:hypothetical protein [Chitinophagaceae bacterium]